MHRLILLAAVLGSLFPGAVLARPKRTPLNELLRVVTPVHRATAPAHPFVNIIVRFGTVRGEAANPASFRAHLGRTEITPLFVPVVENGQVTGMRAALAPPVLRTGRRGNRLRLSVQTGGDRPRRDIDRLRFRAVETPDQAPRAHIAGGNTVIAPGVPVPLSALQSSDPDNDLLTYHWDLGDGTTSDAAQPAPRYGTALANRTVTLTVSDGVLQDTEQTTLFGAPACDEARTPGVMALSAAAALEFGGVPPGTGATRTLTITNTDLLSTSQVRAQLLLDGAAFAVDPAEVWLGPGETAPVTLRFAPGTGGHHMAMLTVVACASKNPLVQLLAHGYGGAAPASGPTLAESPLFHVTRRGEVAATLPDGSHVTIDNGAHLCLSPEGTGSHDPCLADADCTVPGEACIPTTESRIDPVDVCSDGRGHLFLLTDEIFTDLTASDTEQTVGILDLEIDASGRRTAGTVLRRTTSETTQLACDRLPGGDLYLAELRNVSSGSRCFRDAREALTAVNRRNGRADVLAPRIDAVEGYDECNDDVDQATDLEVAPDGTAAYVSLDGGYGYEQGGTFRVWPTPLWISPDIRDHFLVHPDGSILYLTITNADGAATLSLYKIAPEQALNGAVRLRDNPPCATFTVPANGGFVAMDPDGGSLAVAPIAGGFDATVVATFITRGGTLAAQPDLNVKGTVAFSAPASATSCPVLGLTSLEFFYYPRF